MGIIQFDIPSELNRKIEIIQSRKGMTKKSDTVLYILNEAVKDVIVEDFTPDNIKKIKP